MSQMKFISSPENCVRDMLKGLSRVHRNFSVDEEAKVVFYKRASDTVKILSGGGSGHEPFCSGFIGCGMLSAAVAGEIFASPPSQNIFHAISTLASNNNNNGILVIIMNYTGDILNFGLAIERARFQNIQVESVIVDEDCSKFDEENFTVRRRGMGGGVFVMKITGAMAEMGNNLKEIKEACSLIISKLGSIGTCVTSCTVPGVGVLFDLPSDEMELGIGVHGEAGTMRTKLLPIKELISIMLKRILMFLNIETNKEYKICALINNLGSVSQLELAVISNELYAFFDNLRIEICRLYVGSFMTSLDMAGFQICLLNVTDNPEWITCLDYETDAPAWPKSATKCIPIDQQIKTLPKNASSLLTSLNEAAAHKTGIELNETESAIFKNCLETCAQNLIQNKDYLNELDKAVGDGDTGTTINKFCSSVMENIDSLPVKYPGLCFLKLSEIGQIKMGGTLGALYSLAFTAVADYFTQNTDLRWCAVYQSIICSLTKYSTAKLGDRTMLDVLLPVYTAFEDLCLTNYDEKISFTKSVVSVARQKLHETRFMIPKVGRASYVSTDVVKTEDAGAYAVTLILEAISSAI